MTTTETPRTWAVVPVKVRMHNDDLQVWQVRVVGYRAVCGCGYRSSLHRTFAGGRADLRAHRREHNEPAG